MALLLGSLPLCLGVGEVRKKVGCWMAAELLGVGPRNGRRWSHSLEPSQFAGGSKNDGASVK